MQVLTRSFTKKEKGLLLFLSLLVVIAVYYFAVHLPVTTTIQECESEKAALETENTVLLAKVQKKHQMEKELEEILSQEDAKEVPKYDNLASVTEYLNTALSQTTNFDLSVGDVKFDENAAIYRRPVTIRTSLYGYQSVQRVVTKVINCPYLCQIATVNITPYNRRGEEANNSIETRDVNLNITMNFYEGRQK